MRSVWRTLDRQLLRDVAALAAAVAVIGVSFGAIAVASGMSPWLALLMSALVFAGGAQFMAVGVVAAGGSPVAAVLAGLLLNARHLPFGLAVAGVLGRGWASRLVGSHLMIDESVAFALAQRDPERAAAAYWTSGAALFVSWNTGVLAGALAGQMAGNPDAFGLDAAFPAGLLALLLPSLRDRAPRRAGLSGAAVALATTPLLPAGLPVLAGLIGVCAAGRGRTEPNGRTGPDAMAETR
jgi:4-azaleucine resistance transporter AzlC